MSTVVGDRACEHCGRSFTPRRSTARFCGDACRAAHGRSAAVSVPNANGSLRRLATVTAIRTKPLTWEPALASFGLPYQADEFCPECGGPVWSEPCGTWLACRACGLPVIPAAVAAAYDRRAGSVQRNAATDQERDLADVALCARKDELLRWITASRLLPGSELAGGLAAKIRGARSGHRLDQLDRLLHEVLPDVGEVTEITDGDVIEAEIVDDDDDRPYCYDAAGQLVPAMWDGSAWVPVAPRLAISAAPQPMTWAGAVAASGWRLSPAVEGGCQIVELNQLCGAETTNSITGGWVCARHYTTLCQVLTEADRRRTA